jgi:hypothetical protein
VRLYPLPFPAIRSTVAAKPAIGHLKCTMPEFIDLGSGSESEDDKGSGKLLRGRIEYPKSSQNAAVDYAEILNYDGKSGLREGLQAANQPVQAAGIAHTEEQPDPQFDIRTECSNPKLIPVAKEAQVVFLTPRIKHPSVIKARPSSTSQLKMPGNSMPTSSIFEFRNPEWEVYLSCLLEGLAKELRLDATPGRREFHAESYKMLLYEEGAMFKTHQDTEKVPGLFGTLVIALPSRHTGGDVKIQHAGMEPMFLRTSKVQNAFLWWYSDVNHEVLPVESGIRWVLTYNLVRDDPSLFLLMLAGPGSTRIERVLSSWKYQLEKGCSKHTNWCISWNTNTPRPV